MRTETKILQWMFFGETGLSSKFLAACALGYKKYTLAWPLDVSDFRRCYKLAQALNEEELAIALEIAAELSPKWKTIRENWERLSALYERDAHLPSNMDLYKEMKSLGL